MTVLDVRHLSVRRGDRVVIADVSFSVGRSEVLALMGASGSGKTTLLRALAGLDHPAAGTVSVGGGRVGMVLQFHHLFAHLTALQNVWLAPVHVHRQRRPAAVVKAMALLEQLGVAHRAEAMPGELSGGEAQRVAIARALAMDPAVLLMDEPTASLDAGRRSELATTLRGLAAGGCALVVATHDAAFVDACATRTLVVRDGRIQ